jgi:ABC-type uncharacterized transport system involved in gliding motility auxiliary subunit
MTPVAQDHPTPSSIPHSSRRQLVKTGMLSAGVLLLAALLVMVNYLGWKYFKRFDWTTSQLYSLSEKTRNVLKGLKSDVDFIVFLSPDRQAGVYEPTKELLARYASASSHVHVRLVDAEKNPLEAQPLIQKYGLQAAGVVVAGAADKRVIDSGDLAELDYSTVQLGQPPQMTGFKGEQLFTGALVQLSEGRKPKILFTTGHGEHSLDDQGGHGLSGAQQLLGRDNFEMEEWASLGKAEVPAGTDLVVIAGPTGSFVRPELDLLGKYLAQGGRMLVLLDPVLGATRGSGMVSTGLEDWLAGYGVKVGANIVVDPSNPLPFFGPETIFTKQYESHPITKPLSQAGYPVLVTLARSVGKGTAAGMTVSELLRTSAEGWGETNLVDLDKVGRDAQDLAGPVPLGVVAESPAPPAGGAAGARPSRLVVFGDSDFATNQLLGANAGNSVLLSNALNWLVEREALLGIPPKKTEQVHLSLTSSEMRMIFLSSVVVLPLIAAICGVFVFYRRRR